MQIGEMLREAREEKELSLDDIQEITKIQKRYLVAIEQEDYHALPGRFYARAFIKEYAQAVGLDSAVILEGFDEESIEQQEEENVPYTRFDRSKREDKGSSIFSFLPTVIVVVLVICIIFLAYFLLQKSSSTDNNDSEIPQENDEIVRKKEAESETEDDDGENEVTEEDDEEESDDEEEKDDNESEFDVVEVGEGGSPLSTLDYQSSDDEAILSLEPNSETYLQISDANESVLYEGTVTEGEEIDDIDISDEERVYINVGNAPALTIKINGDELEYPVDKDEKVHQKLWINLKKAEE